MGFPFTKIVVDQGEFFRTVPSASLCAEGRQTKAFCRLIRQRSALSLSIVSFAWNSKPEHKKRKPKICSGQIRNSEPYVRHSTVGVNSRQANAKFKLGTIGWPRVQFRFRRRLVLIRAISARCSITRSPCPIWHAIKCSSAAGSSARRPQASARFARTTRPR
jgi:hypothetical protein